MAAADARTNKIKKQKEREAAARNEALRKLRAAEDKAAMAEKTCKEKADLEKKLKDAKDKAAALDKATQDKEELEKKLQGRGRPPDDRDEEQCPSASGD